MDIELLQKAQATLMGVMIGDAMGMPVERMSHKEILTATHGHGIVNFADPSKVRTDGRVLFKQGETTDDWQLTAAVARAIIRDKECDFWSLMEEQVKELAVSTRGWGGTTKKALGFFQEHFEKYGRERLPELRAKMEKAGPGTGNGVAMKVAPVALYYALKPLEAMDDDMLALDVSAFGITHRDFRAKSAAYAVAWLIRSVIRKQIYDDSVTLQYRWEELESAVRQFEFVYGCLPFGPDTIAGRLHQIWEIGLDRAGNLGTGCFAVESVPFAIATFFSYANEFYDGVLFAVNAGGDTDTTASIVGALIGANAGLRAIPREWRNFHPRFEEAERLGLELYEAVCRK